MSKLENIPRIFTENDFVSMFIQLLSENGIVRLNETELKKKLYYYYLKEEYRELFQDIVPFQRSSAGDRLLNIENGMLNFKTFGGNVIWDNMYPENLILTKVRNLDLSFYEKYLSEDGIRKMHQMAYEFGVRNKAETNSKESFNIYAKNPNSFYHLCVGNYYKEIYSWGLITDGDIKNLSVNKTPEEHLYYENLTKPCSELKLKNATSFDVEIENASYTLLQGLENGTIKRLKLYTNLLDLNKLNQLGNIDDKECLSISSDNPSIKKYVLK